MSIISWDGGDGTDSSWYNPANWDSPNNDIVPNLGDDVYINDMPEQDITVYLDGAASINSLHCEETLFISGGSLDVTSSSNIVSLTINSGTLSGSGMVDIGGNLTVNSGVFEGTVSVGGELICTGYGATFNGPSASIEGNATVNAYLQGTGDVTVNGVLTWTNGFMTGSGTTYANGGLHITGTPEDRRLATGRTLVNAGDALFDQGVLWTDDRWSPDQQLAPVRIVNLGTFEVQEGANIFNLSNVTGGEFWNEGTFAKTTGSDVSCFWLQFHNAGTVDVQSGTLEFSTSLQTGHTAETRLSGGSISTSAPLDIQGGSLTGLGDVYGGVLNNGSLSPGLAVPANPFGHVQIAGAYSQCSGGVFQVQLGGLTPEVCDHVTVNGPVTLDGALNVTLANCTPQRGQQFTIIDNQSSDLVEGEFADLPEGAAVRIGPFELTISYHGGTGNDVTLTATRFVVTSNLDTVDASDDTTSFTLREAILATNVHPGMDTIVFDIPGSGAHTIRPLSALPAITDPLLLDGYSQPGARTNSLEVGDNAVLLIELDGTDAGLTSGLTISAGNCAVEGFVINNFAYHGIDITTNGNNVIAGNFIGTDVTGTLSRGNGREGYYKAAEYPSDVLLDARWYAGIAVHGGSQFNRIGTDGDERNDVAERNIISGNQLIGVRIFGADANYNIVAGNYIGTDASGNCSLANGAVGLNLSRGAKSNRIGTNGNGQGDEAERNIISGNGNAYPFAVCGLSIVHAGTDNNVVAGNYIGTTASGTERLGNGPDAIGIGIAYGPNGNRIGSNLDGRFDDNERNVISGNAYVGVDIIGPAVGNVVAGNYIGTTCTGIDAMGNGYAANVYSVYSTPGGITIRGGQNNYVLGNVVSGNEITYLGWGGGGVGISLRDDARGNVVAGNFVGVDKTGTTPVPNQGAGILINNATGNVIGTDGNGFDDEAEGNVISANGAGGVILENAAFGNVVAGNRIGLDVMGTVSLGNTGDGILIRQFSQFNRIGTNGDAISDHAERNIISGNSMSGVDITGSTTSLNLVAGNLIGVALDLTPLGNGGDGVRIQQDAQANQIGTGNPSQIVVEAENFTSRVASSANSWQIVPDEHPGVVPRVGARDGKYLQTLPDRGGASGNPGTWVGAAVTYSVFVPTSGQYRLYARWDGHDAASDSLYASILELRDGSGGQADWYRYSHSPHANFTTTPWDGVGQFEGTSSTDSNVPVVWTFETPGYYTVSFLMREDGSAIDTFVLQPAAMLAPEGYGPPASPIETSLMSNWIAFNGGSGVSVLGDSSVGNTIRANHIFSNGSLGIDLGGDGVTSNDPGDADAGENMQQNYPLLESVILQDGRTTISGILNSRAMTKFTVDFYANSEAGPSGYGEGARWLGWTEVTTDGAGNAEFNVDFAEMIGGQWITATATDPDGNTSEFSLAEDAVAVIHGTNDNDSLLVEEGTTDGGVKVTITNQQGSEEFHVLGGRLRLFGLGGDDTFTVNALPAGGIYLDGGDQDDVFELNAGDGGPVTIVGLLGDDEATIYGASAAGVTVDLGEGDDDYAVYFGDVFGSITIDDSGTMGTDELDVNGTGRPDRLEKTTGTVTFQPLDDPPSLPIVLAFSNIEDVTVRGAEGDDIIVDPGANTTILGGPGDDTILVNATFGNGLFVDGEEGADTIVIQLGELAGPVTVIDTGTTGTTTIRIVGTDSDDRMILTASQLTSSGEVIYLDLGFGETNLILDGGEGEDLVTIEGSLPEGVTTQLISAILSVDVDVKPDSSTNVLNLLSNGVIPVALLTTASFDAGTVDVSSVRFAGAGASYHSFEDVDGDGDLDLVLHFRIQDTSLDAAYVAALLEDLDDGTLDSNHQDIEATLLGLTIDGMLFEGTDILDAFYAGKALQEVLLNL